MLHQPVLTILIHTKNAQEHIQACIKSCKPLKAEILVVDMQSSDNTVLYAKKMGARILQVPDSGYVEAARQIGIDAANGTWIFILDVDERLTPSLRTFVRNYIQSPTHKVVRFPRKNIFLGSWMKQGLLWPDFQVRLFAKGSLTWTDAVHAQPQTKDTIFSLPAFSNYAILHYHSHTVLQVLQKIHQQSSHETYYVNHPPTAKTAFSRLSSEFANRFYVHQGYKDGMRGFVWAKLMEYYRFLEFAFYWEQKGYPEVLSAQELQTLWDHTKQLELLRSENERFRNSKFYSLYVIVKKILRKRH